MTKHATDRCNRCGTIHEESRQLVDPLSRWAILLTCCSCGHRWTTIHTSPNNLALLRAWVVRGLPTDQIPPTTQAPGWRSFRLEGLYPTAVPRALDQGAWGQ